MSELPEHHMHHGVRFEITNGRCEYRRCALNYERARSSARVAVAVDKFKSIRRALSRVEKLRDDLQEILGTLSPEEFNEYVRITEELASKDE